MAVALVANASQGAAGGVATTSAINTTGSTIICVQVTSNSNGINTLTDSASNTWTALSNLTGPLGTAAFNQLFYCLSPTTSSSHTFTFNGNSPSIAVAAFSGVTGFSAENGTTANSSTIQPGAVTPAYAGELVVAGLCSGGNSATATIDSSFTVTDFVPFLNGSHLGVGMAYKIVTGTTAVNPTWTMAAGIPLAATIALFASGGTPAARRAFLLVIT